jgi:hypothetical protein
MSPAEPRCIDAQRAESNAVVRLRNVVVLSIVGYVVITTIVFFTQVEAVLKQPFDIGFWIVGLFGSVLFASSEAFNLNPLERRKLCLLCRGYG